LPQNIEHQRRLQRAVAANHLPHIPAGDIFLGDEVDPVFLAHFVDLHDAGVHERRGSTRLVMKPADVVGIASQVGIENFERNLPAKRLLLS
jgi:hypothetical protein